MIVYPLLVGVLLGAFQTGLFFQLTFTLSSGFGTYLLVTLCWLVGSALGVTVLARARVPLTVYLVLSLAAYGVCAALVNGQPFNTELWPLYALIIGMAGFYPGVFFARMGTVFSARSLFLWENNGFLVGLALTTLGFMVGGRAVLWVLPPLLALIVIVIGYSSERIKNAMPSVTPHTT